MEINAHRKQIIKNIDDLPTLPVIMMKILECIDDPHSSAEDLKSIIIKDPSTSTKVLSLANSAYYGYSRSIEDITRAVVVLGFETIIDIALSVSLSSILTPPAISMAISLDELWEHSIAVGEACRLCAKGNIYPYKERAFLIGLIHDIGKIVIAYFFPNEFNTAVENARINEEFIYDTERKVLNFSHNDAGVWLADEWNLPFTISVPIHFHHDPQNAPEEFQIEAVLAHFADYLVKYSNIGSSGDDNKLPILSPLVFSRLKVDEDKINSYSQELEKLKPKIHAFMKSIF